MNAKNIFKTMRRLGVVLSALSLGAGPALAADYYLCAKKFNKTLPDGATTAMWGFAADTNGAAAGGCDAAVASAPGPRLVVPPGDNILTVHLTNVDVPEPVSIVIPGQQAAMAPVFFPRDNQNRQRVRSFTHETAMGATETYTWNSVKPGSYVYHSGSHPAVQVQMGLYGAMTKDVGAGLAYDGVAYDAEVVLFYAEVDPALHAAVATNKYGPGKAMTSTVNYLPTYFLVNGDPHNAGTQPIPGGPAGGRTLIRFFSMGLKNHAPMLQGGHMKLVAENGSPYPYPKEVYSFLLPASSTRDAVFTPATVGEYPIYDRMLSLANHNNQTGGLLSVVSVGPASDRVAILRTEHAGSTLSVWADSSGAPAALLTVDGYGAMTHAGNPDYDYSAALNTVPTAPASVTVTSSQGGADTRPVPYAAPPTAVSDGYGVHEGDVLSVPPSGVLANDSKGGWFTPGMEPRARVVKNPVNGTLALAPDGGFTYTHDGGETIADSFTYRTEIVDTTNADAVMATSSPAVVLLTVAPVNDPPVVIVPLADDSAMQGKPYSRNVAAFFGDPEGDALSFTMSSLPAVTGLVMDPATGLISGIPSLTSEISVTVRATDTQGAFVEETFILTVLPFENSAPIAVNDYGRTTANTTVFVDILANDTDEGQPVGPADVAVGLRGRTLLDAGRNPVRELGGDGNLYDVKITKKGGSAVYRGDGTVKYTPPSRFLGSDLFTYAITDKDPVTPLTSKNATVRVDVVR